MDNELILIAEMLWDKYGSGRHYTIERAQHLSDGVWSLVIKDYEKPENQEEKDDN